METVFGVPTGQVTTKMVETFLSEATQEPLLWEAKGDEQAHRVHPGSVLKAVCAFANSHDGGDLILGGVSRDMHWSLPGVDIGKAEITPWVSSIISSGLRPVPPFDVQALRLEGKRQAAVVHVHPTPTPPCITKDGTVYVRVAGQSLPVTDPVELARLYEAGERARLAAETIATQASSAFGKSPRSDGPQRPLAIAAGAAVGRPADLSRAIFRQEVRDRLNAALDELLPTTSHISPPVSSSSDTYIDQATLAVVRAAPMGSDEVAWVGVSWDGGVAAGRATDVQPAHQEISAHYVPRLLGLTVRALEIIGARGPTWLRVEIPRDPHVWLSRWIESTGEPLDPELLAGIEREFARRRGEQVWEP